MSTVKTTLAALALAHRDRLQSVDPHKVAEAMLADMSLEERAEALVVTLPDYVRHVLSRRGLTAQDVSDNIVDVFESEPETSELGTIGDSKPREEASPAPTPGPSRKFHRGGITWRKNSIFWTRAYAPSIGNVPLGSLDRDSLRAVINFKYEKATEVHVTAVRYEKLLVAVHEQGASKVSDLPESLVKRIVDGDV